MTALSDVVMQLAASGLGVSRAIQQQRHLIDAELVRRAPRGRPVRTRAECTFPELADIVLSLGAQSPVHGPKKSRRLGSYVVERFDPMPELFALPEHGLTLRSWLIAVLQRLAELPRDQRKTLYLTKPAPTLTLHDELTVPYPAADRARFEWGGRCIDFRPRERDFVVPPEPPTDA